MLEIAAGTGIATRAHAIALGDAHIEATDLNETMVAFAATHSVSPTVRWSAANAMALPFENGRFELAVCQFGVMFFPDRLRAFREVRRVLAPRGTFLFNVRDNLAHNDVARIVSEAVEAATPPASTGTYVRRDSTTSSASSSRSAVAQLPRETRPSRSARELRFVTRLSRAIRSV